jgi:hypothetical protein
LIGYRATRTLGIGIAISSAAIRFPLVMVPIIYFTQGGGKSVL